VRNARIYSAPSLAALIQFLMSQRLSGTLTIRPALGIRQGEVHITVEYGRPTHIYWGFYQVEANEFFLRRLNAWGEIHFTFLPTVAPLLQLPPPQSVRQPQEPLQTTPALPPPPVRSNPVNTRPPQATPVQKTPSIPTTPAIAPEVLVPLLTAYARGYPFERLPRYDRTIFLLINGQRSVSDLAKLTKRSLEKVYASLYRLKEQHLIVI
jgi:hypothetical protein